MARVWPPRRPSVAARRGSTSSPTRPGKRSLDQRLDPPLSSLGFHRSVPIKVGRYLADNLLDSFFVLEVRDNGSRTLVAGHVHFRGPASCSLFLARGEEHDAR